MRSPLLVLALFGCKPEPEDTGTDPAVYDALVTTTALPTGDPDCAYGGTRLDAGLDDGEPGGTADDGVLQAEEVDETALVCAEAPDPVHALVTATTPLSEGDPTCADGGHHVAWGLDDGVPGGTADDGVLQDDEIDDETDLCFDPPPPIEPPTIEEVFAIPAPGTPGTHAIDLSGGDGQAAGRGGYLSIEAYGGPLPTAVIARTDAPATFTIPPAPVTVELGPVPAVVASNTVVPTWDGSDDHPAGLHYYDRDLWIGDDRVTGLHVQTGAILTLPDNYDGYRFAADVLVEGTLATTVESDWAYNLQITCDDFVAPGLVDVRGRSSSGRLEIYALAKPTSTIVVPGSLRANGQNGPLPGTAGRILLVAAGDVRLPGEVQVRGGRSGDNSHAGGNAGDLEVWSLGGTVAMAGTIEAQGGDGSTGGQGGTVLLRAGGDTGEGMHHGIDDFERSLDTMGPGSVVQTGTLRIQGGYGASGPGGGAGAATYDARGSSVRLGGSIEGWGGTGTDGGPGGGGAAVYAFLSPYALENPHVIPSELSVSASLDLSGGDGAVGGGQGGSLELAVDVTATEGGDDEHGHPGDNPLLPSGRGGIAVSSLVGPPVVVTLAGYGGGFDFSGGSGETAGSAGELDVTVEACLGAYPSCALPVLGERWLRMEVPIAARGGSGDLLGGRGGGVWLAIDDRHNALDADAGPARIDLLVPADVSGGTATDGPGGAGGWVEVAATQGDVVIGGALDASAGDGCDCARGADGGLIEISGRDVTVAGDLDVHGAITGGEAGDLTVRAMRLEHAGDILAWSGDVPVGAPYDARQGGEVVLAADVVVTGDVAAWGGTVLGAEDEGAAQAGRGGTVEVTARRATLGAVDVSAGDVTSDRGCDGSEGGRLEVWLTEALDSVGPITADGADCSSPDATADADAGSGGYVALHAPSLPTGLDATADGGDAVGGDDARAGGGGTIVLGAAASGFLSASGGAASAERASAGNGGYVRVESHNAAAVAVDGGVAAGGSDYAFSGDGGGVEVWGNNAGDLSATGAAATGSQPYPGRGGTIEISGDNGACLDVGGGGDDDDGTIEVGGADTGTCPS